MAAVKTSHHVTLGRLLPLAPRRAHDSIKVGQHAYSLFTITTVSWNECSSIFTVGHGFSGSNHLNIYTDNNYITTTIKIVNPKAPWRFWNKAPNNDASSLLFHRIKVQIAHQGTEESNEGNIEIGISCINWLKPFQTMLNLAACIGPLQSLMKAQDVKFSSRAVRRETHKSHKHLALDSNPKVKSKPGGMLTGNKEPTWIDETWGKRHDERDEHEEKRIGSTQNPRRKNDRTPSRCTNSLPANQHSRECQYRAWYCSSKKTHSHENKGHEDWEENDAKVGLRETCNSTPDSQDIIQWPVGNRIQVTKSSTDVHRVRVTTSTWPCNDTCGC